MVQNNLKLRPPGVNLQCMFEVLNNLRDFMRTSSQACRETGGSGRIGHSTGGNFLALQQTSNTMKPVLAQQTLKLVHQLNNKERSWQEYTAHYIF